MKGNQFNSLLGILLLNGCCSHSKPVTSPPRATAASRITDIQVSQIVSVSSSLPKAESQLSKLVKDASQTGATISIAGARHSMGGQTAYPNATVVDMTPLKHL